LKNDKSRKTTTTTKVMFYARCGSTHAHLSSLGRLRWDSHLAQDFEINLGNIAKP
jgi:hypothetical protein